MATTKKTVEQAPVIDANTKNVVNDATPNESGANATGNDETQKDASNDATAPAGNDAPPPAQKQEPTSPKLDELKASLKTAWAKMIAFEDPSSEDALAANLDVYKIRQEIKAEIANIEKTTREQEMLEKRNARVQLAQNLVDAVLTEQAFKSETYDLVAEIEVVKADGTTVMQKPQELIDQMNELTHARKSAFEIVANELAARYATSTPAKTSGTNDKPAGEKSGTTKSEQIEEMMKAGKSYDDMIAAGMGDGTIRTVAGAIKYKKNSDGTYSPRV